MSITLRPWSVLVLVGVIGILIGISIGNLSAAESNPKRNALNLNSIKNSNKQIANSNKQIVRLLDTLNSRVRGTNDWLQTVVDYMEFDRDEYLAPLLSATESSRNSLDSMETNITSIEAETRLIGFDIQAIGDNTFPIESIRKLTSQIDLSTLGTCLYVSDDGGRLCD